MGQQLQLVQDDNNSERQNLDKAMQALEKKNGVERVDKLIQLIMKSRWAADQAPPIGAEKVGMVGAWAEALSHIPSDYLDEYYERATRRKTNGFAVNALDIIAEWNRLAELRELDKIIKPEYRGKY